MTDLIVPVAASALPALRADPEKIEELARCAESFRYFLRYWTFASQEQKKTCILGEVLWPAQETAATTMEGVERAFFLKARKLGETTLECAFDGWVARFRDRNARVHLFSRRDDAAVELLEAVEFGLGRLPEWMQLPVSKSTTHELALDAGSEDKRLVKAYPADEDTAVEATCTHGHVDEWARMRNPRKVWQAIEPSMSGSCHFVTTGKGPTNYTSEFWRRSVAGETGFVPVFIDALQRPDRNEEWLKRKWRGMSESDAKQEYPMTPEDALSGEGEYFFGSEELDRAAEETIGRCSALDGRAYIEAWDVGRHKDAAVGIVLDVTGAVVDAVRYERHHELPYPALQRLIEEVHREYGGLVVIEKNSAGEAVMENLEISEHEVTGFTTSMKSKPVILAGLKIGFQKQLVRYDAAEWPQLDQELRGYRLPDDDVVQDSVMALAIGYAHARQGRTAARRMKGRVGRISTW